MFADAIPVIFTFALAAFVQSVSGFGGGLVSMALLPSLIGIRSATPLVALTSIFIEVVLLIRFRESLSLRDIWMAVLASVAGIPLGMALVGAVSERAAMFVLGLILIGYAVYALLGRHLPKLQNPLWGAFAGFMAGLLGGAYNTSGPPVILYADTQGWKPERFKSNLQGFFLLSSSQILLGHVLAGNYRVEVLRWLPWALPAILAGLLAGWLMDRRIPPVLFRRIVLTMLIVMGLMNLF